MAAILLALASTVIWGTTDFAGGMLTRRLPLAGVTVISQASGFVLLLVILAFSRTIDWRSAWLGAIGGVALGIGLACFYAALARGTMSIVSPITACAAVVPVALALGAGERPSVIALAGSGIALGGAILASFEERSSKESGRSNAVVLAVAAAFAFGIWIYFLGRGSHDGSAFSTLVGSALFALATQHGLISVVAVLGSLFAIVTVMLAYLILGERISRVQRVGVIVALCGVAVVAAA